MQSPGGSPIIGFVMGEPTCPNCEARVSEAAALCPECGFDIARSRAAGRGRQAAAAFGEPRHEYRHGPGVSIFLAVIATAFLTLGGLVAYGVIFGSLPDSPANVGFIVAAFLVTVLLVWAIIRRAGIAFVTTPRALIRGKLVVPFESMRFASLTRLASRPGASATSFSILFRNERLKGAVLIPGTIREHDSLVEEIVARSSIGQDLGSPVQAHCPYCGERQERKRFASGEGCTKCGRSLADAVARLNENTVPVYTGNRIGLIVVTVIVVSAFAIIGYAAPRLWDRGGLFIAIFMIIAFALPLVGLWGMALKLYRHERAQIRLVDLLRREPVADNPSIQE